MIAPTGSAAATQEGIQCVLLVDDEPDIRTVGELTLQVVGGWTVATAGSGDEALQCVRDVNPDVILLDVMMPGLDGPQTLARLQDDPATAAIPVIFMTAKVLPAEVDEYVSLGAIGVIPKPFEPMELADEIRNLLACANGST